MDNRALQLFTAAMEQPQDTRQDWLTDACQGDGELFANVLHLIDSDAQASALLPTGGAWAEVAPLAENQQFGAYRINAKIGQGGMGTVYEAERVDGAFERTVAIKLVSQRAMNAETQSRFVNERQILANLQHPNIAALLDGGTQGDTAYLVMEYIEGHPFDYNAERPNHTTLKIFLDVCSAVQHAHNNLVLHRDIKPANVLVSEAGEIKLLDFGVAKITQAISAGAAADLTGVDPAPLTPNYAAPERLVGEPATIVSDVYSLGVYLYQLIHGQQPYNVRGLGFPAAHNIVTQTKPLNVKKASDLDLIIHTAMHPDPKRRYATVAALASDITQYLANRAIQARGDDWRYLLNKVVAKYRVPLAAASVALVLLVGALAFSVNQAKVATEQRIRAESTTRFLSSIFSAVDPYSGDNFGPTTNLKSLIDVAEQYVGEEFLSDPEAAASIYTLLAGVYSNLQLIDDSNRLIASAEALMEANNLPQGLNTIATMRTSISNWYNGGELQKAAAGCDRLMASRHLLQGYAAEEFNSLASCADVRLMLGDSDTAKKRLEEAVNLLREAGPKIPNHVKLVTLPQIANVYASLSDQENSTKIIEEAIAIAESMGASAYASLAYLYLFQSLAPNQIGDSAESLRYTTLSLETAEKSQLDRNGLRFGYIRLYHADRLIDLNRLEEAAEVYHPARKVLLQAKPEFSPYHSLVHFTDYKLAYKEQDFERAATSILESRRIRQGSGEAYGQWLAATDHALGKTYVQLGRFVEALPLLQKAYAFYLDLLGADHERVKTYKKVLDNAHKGIKTS